MTIQYVTVWDPTNVSPVGDVIDGQQAIATAKQRRHVVLLPTDPSVYYSATPGFVYRPWGNGWEYDQVNPTRGCPMMIAATPELTWVYWAILALPIRKSEPMHGNLRLIANGASGGIGVGLSQDVRLRSLQAYEVGPRGGVVAIGRCAVGVVSPGNLGLSVHGVGSNVRVLWSAVSIAGEKIEVQDGVPV
jgi:hypothetical protein